MKERGLAKPDRPLYKFHINFLVSGEIYSDFVEKRYLSVITSIFKDPNLPERHEWSLELFKTKETYVFEWYIMITRKK